MKAPAIVYVGVGCMAGAWAAQCLEPLPTLARWAAMSALVAAPIGWRWRWLLAAALVLSMVPGRAPPPAPARLSGQIVGPVLRAQRSVSASVATADGGRWRVRIGQMSNAQPVLAPCDRLELGGARAAGDELWVSASKVRHQSRRCASPWRWAHDARERLLDHLPAGRGFDLMAAVVLGDRSRLGADDSTLFRRAGVSHLIAVSGLHLAVVVGLLFALVRRLLAVFYPTSWPTRWAAGAALVGAVTFTMVTGAAVSTVRALAMVAVLLVPMLVGRRVEATVALAVAGMAVAVLHRELLANLGFQLSMAATAVLVMAVRRPPERTWWRWVEGAVLASAATFAVTAPIAGPRFGEVSPIALLSNLVVVPVIELGVLPLAFIGLSVASLWPGAGELLLRVGAAVAELALELIAWFARVEPWSWPTGWAWSAVALASAVAVARWGSIASRLALVVAGLAAAIGWVATASPEPALQVHVVDVGQGDSMVVEWPNHRLWVIDTGPSSRRQPLLRFLRRRGAERIDRLILTHPHPDHDGAAAEIAEGFDVADTWRADHGGPRLGAHRIGEATAWFLAPFYRGPSALADPVLSANDNSIVVLVEYAGRRILLLGDVEAEAEARLLDAYPELGGVDIVKIGHHGSQTSSTPALVRWASPQLVAISVGRGNPFGHPSAQVLERWRLAGARVLRTDVHGTITITVRPGGGLRVHHQLEHSL